MEPMGDRYVGYFFRRRLTGVTIGYHPQRTGRGGTGGSGCGSLVFRPSSLGASRLFQVLLWKSVEVLPRAAHAGPTRPHATRGAASSAFPPRHGRYCHLDVPHYASLVIINVPEGT
jgi:hypothetical protein